MHILQVVVPFFIAGFGTCVAGLLLDHVQYWSVFKEVDSLFLLVPALLGLKGNLQMTLASRLSTHSHLGHMKTKRDLFSLTCANLSLNQCLSTAISLCASILVVIIHFFLSDLFDIQHALLIMATALLTSSVTSFVLDIIMILVVHISARFDINPDNVATPIAASLGDITALVQCSHLANAFYDIRASNTFYWLTGLVIIVYIGLLPFFVSVTQENTHTDKILVQASHWYPLITAMVISTISGVILKLTVFKSNDIALFQPVINGVGGNLVAVQASRLSTLLHRNYPPGQLPDNESVCMNPSHMFCSNQSGFLMTRLLMFIVIPGQLVFYFFCILVNTEKSDPSIPFLLLYITGSEIQVMILLYLAHVLTYLLWTHRVDPDNCTIPYLTSLSDVVGSCIITVICLFAIPSMPKQTSKR